MKNPIAGTQCVYTIVSSKTIEAAFENNGAGEFEESSRWASALRHLNDVAPSELYPLLLGNAASIIGVEWIALIDSIEIEGDRTKIRFSNIFSVKDPFSRSEMIKVSDGQPLSDSFIRPYVPCFIQGDLETSVLEACSVDWTEDESGLEAIDLKTSDDYLDALKSIEDSITANQKVMLIAHGRSTNQTISTKALADVAGYPSHGTANIQYGRLGRKFADFFGVVDLDQQTLAMAYNSGETDDKGHFTWKLRGPLVNALYRFGWIGKPDIKEIDPKVEVDFERAVATEEIAGDPKCRGIPETTRVALIEARIGQGAYRNRLLQVWDGACAVTGVEVEPLLIASHIKSWADASNTERLDEYNGLPLTPNLDKLFDRGLISFSDEGCILVKPEISWLSLSKLGVSQSSKLRKTDSRHHRYLAEHRLKFHFSE